MQVGYINLNVNNLLPPLFVLIRELNSQSERFLSLLTPSDGRRQFNNLSGLR